MPRKNANPMTVTRFERRNWHIQRLGWIGLSIFLLAGISGALGQGPLGRRVADAGPGHVTHDGILREHNDATITWRVVPADTVLRIDVDGEFTSLFSSGNWTPAPDATAPTADGLRASWSARPGDTVTVRYEAPPLLLWRHAPRTRVDDGDWVDLRLFVLP